MAEEISFQIGVLQSTAKEICKNVEHFNILELPQFFSREN